MIENPAGDNDLDRSARTAASDEKYIFKLYITGAAPSSLRAVVNLRKFCEEYLADCFEIEIVDIFKYPQVAKVAQLVAIPTLVKELPLPVRRFVGDMSDTDRLRRGLGIA